MKTLFNTLLLFIISFSGLAQIQPHTFAVSSNFSYDRAKFESKNINNTGDLTNQTLRIEPKIGFFISKRFCVGASVSYIWSNSSGSWVGNQDITNKTFGQGAFVRYYQPIAKKLYAIAGFDFSWIKQWNEYSVFDQFSGSVVNYEEEVKGSILQKGIGLAYFINNNIAIELLGDHLTRLGKNRGLFNSSFENRFLLSLGFQVFLTKRSE